MQTYSIYVPSQQAHKNASDKAVFVKHGFSIKALCFSALWLLYNKMWYAFVLYFAGVSLFSFLGYSLKISGDTQFYISVALQFWLAIEAKNLLCTALEHRGYQLRSIICAQDQTAAELHYFSLQDHEANA